MAPRKISPHLPATLRYFAWRMTDNPEAYTLEEGKMMDRALRTCPGIIDIDRVWVRWSYIAEKQGWLTANELVMKKRGYQYPEMEDGDGEDT